MNNLIAYILYVISIVIYAIFYLKKSFEINLRFFLVYLFFMFSFEMMAYYVKHGLGFYNLWVYNSLTFLEFNCLLLFVKDILVSKKTNKIVIGLIFIFNIIYFATTLYYLNEGAFLESYNSIAFISGGFLIAIALFLFYQDFLSSNEILNYKKSLSFWITFGLLLYYLGTIPITSIMNYMNGTPKVVLDSLFIIQYLLVIFMYSCFIFGAIWSQKKFR